MPGWPCTATAPAGPRTPSNGPARRGRIFYARRVTESSERLISDYLSERPTRMRACQFDPAYYAEMDRLVRDLDELDTALAGRRVAEAERLRLLGLVLAGADHEEIAAALVRAGASGIAIPKGPPDHTAALARIAENRALAGAMAWRPPAPIVLPGGAAAPAPSPRG